MEEDYNGKFPGGVGRPDTGPTLIKGIVAEKIAVACVRMLLNGPDGQPEEIYAYISWLFRFTRNLRSGTRDIRISGRPSRRNLHPQQHPDYPLDESNN